jgi:hypothetical protein
MQRTLNPSPLRKAREEDGKPSFEPPAFGNISLRGDGREEEE